MGGAAWGVEGRGEREDEGGMRIAGDGDDDGVEMGMRMGMSLDVLD